MATTKIEWADAVWNPSTGCTEVSAGCDHCYAHVMADRLKAMGQPKYANGFTYTEHWDALRLPMTWKKGKRIFVNSMSDLFHERATYPFVKAALDVMCHTTQHTYLVLTKRPGKMRTWVQHFCKERDIPRLPGHIWLGTSVENQAAADLRIPPLLDTLAAVRWVSCEPLLDRLHLWGIKTAWGVINSLTGIGLNIVDPPGAREFDLDARINWVVAGGESGQDARPCHIEWARDLRDQCQATGTAFFWKQWGGATHSAGGRLLDGRTWDEYPTVTEAP